MSGFLPGSMQPVRVEPLGYFLHSYVGSPSDVCQPLDRIIICRVKSGQTAFQLHQRASLDSVRHRLGLGHRSMDPPTSLLASAISFYRRPQWPSRAVQKRFSIDQCTGHSFHTQIINFQKYAQNIFNRILNSPTKCFAEYEQRTLYGAVVVTLAMLLRLINCRCIIIIIIAINGSASSQ